MPKRTEGLRQPIAEPVSAVLTRVDGLSLLSERALEGGEALLCGEFEIRFGITYLGRPHSCIVPELVVADYGELLGGEQAWDFLMERAHLHPRADVCGYGSDGAEDMPPLKQLDFEHPYHALAYQHSADRRALTRVSALITRDCAAWSPRLLKHLPCYPSVSDWRRHA